MKLLKNLGVKTKIGLLSLAMFLILLTVGTTSIIKITQLNTLLDEVYQSHLTPIVNMGTVKSDIEDIRAMANELLDAGSDETARASIIDAIDLETTALLKDLEALKSMENYEEISASVDAYLAAKDNFIEESANMAVPTEQATVQAPAQSNDQTAVTETTTNEATVTETTTEVVTAQPNAENMSFIGTLDDARNTVVALFESSIQTMVTAADQNQVSSNTLVKNSILSTVILVLLSIVLTIILTLRIGRSIVRPLQAVTAKLKEISENEGDLTQRIEVTSGDELGILSQSFNAFMDRLSAILSEVAQASELIGSSSKRIRNVTQNTTESMEALSATVVEIASSTSESASLLEEMNHHVSDSAGFSTSTSDLSASTALQAIETKNNAAEGAAKIEEVVTAMTEISSASHGVMKLVGDLDASSKKIGDIIVMISAISDQTNLLALNASIEAARAGEAGRGFTVVANEIKKLADESKHASKQIADLVMDNQRKSATVVASVESVEKEIEQGEIKANQVGYSISQIIQGVDEMVSQIDNIKSANTKIAHSATDLESAMEKMVVTSNEIAEGTETISGTIEEQLSTMIELDDASIKLNQLAQRLNDVMGGFKI